MLILLITHRALSEALRPVGRAHVPFIADPKCTAKYTHLSLIHISEPTRPKR